MGKVASAIRGEIISRNTETKQEIMSGLSEVLKEEKETQSTKPEEPMITENREPHPTAESHYHHRSTEFLSLSGQHSERHD